MLDAFHSGMRFMVLGIFVLFVVVGILAVVIYKGRMGELGKDIRFPSLAFSLILFIAGLFLGQATVMSEVLHSCRLMSAAVVGDRAIECRIKL
jgi:hypothetical protein